MPDPCTALKKHRFVNDIIHTIERPGVSAVCLLPAQFSVQLADADVRIAAVIVADPVPALCAHWDVGCKDDGVWG